LVKTTFRISKMDCPSEERMIRMKLEGLTNIHSLQFDIPGRTLEVYHTDSYDNLLAALDSLHLDTNRNFHNRTLKERNSPVALSALANKLARAAYSIMRDQVPYEEAKLFG
jgi:hypothetical protein